MLAPHDPLNDAFLRGLPSGKYFCWGCTPNRKKTFTKIEEGDQILISENGSKLLKFVGIVSHKFPHADKSLADHIWGSHHEYIMIIESVREIAINKSDFVLKLYNNQDPLTSPRYIGRNDPDSLADWSRYNKIRGIYGL